MREEERSQTIRELEEHIDELEGKFISGLADLSKVRMLIQKVALDPKEKPNKGKK